MRYDIYTRTHICTHTHTLTQVYDVHVFKDNLSSYVQHTF